MDAVGSVSCRLSAGILLLLATLSNSLAATGWAPFMSGNQPAPTFTPAWTDAILGAGGYVSDVQIFPDGTKIVRTDTNGYFIWNGTIWNQLFTAANIPSGNLTTIIQNGPGTIPVGGTEVGVCAYTTSSNTTTAGSTSIIYALLGQELYKTTNKTVSWTDTGQSITLPSGGGNDGTVKANSPYIWCDPASSGQVVYVSQPTGSVLKSTNGGTSFSAISGPTAASGNTGSMIVGDPNSTVTSGVTQTLYIFVPGTGVYQSTNGGSSWTLTTGTPTISSGRLYIDKFSQVFVTPNGNSGTLYKYASGTWSSISVGSSFTGLAIDPTSSSAAAEHLVAVIPAGEPIITTNGGGSWTGPNYNYTIYTPADIPWLGTTNQGGGASNYIDVSAAAFDAAGTDMFVAFGYGVYEMSPPVASAGSYVSSSVGIEQLVGNQIISPSGLVPCVGNWDRGIFCDNIPGQYATNQYNGPDRYLRASWDVATAPGTSTTISAIVNNENNGSSNQSAVSTDGGVTWTLWGAYPTTVTGAGGGMIAMDTTTDWIAVTDQGQAPYCTTNGGGSWSAITFPGSPANNWLGNYYFVRHVLESDKATSGVLYAYDAQVGLFSSSGGCAGTWTKVYSGALDGGGEDGYNATLKAVPGNAGNLFFTSGQNGCGATPPQPCSQPWHRSTNGGSSWSSVPGFEEVITFGFGAAKPGGGGYPSIYALGWYNGSGSYVYGLYQSNDNATTWTLINPWGPTSLNGVAAITGDPDVYGRVYQSIGAGAGAISYDTADACPSIAWVSSSIKPTQNITGTYTLTAQGSGLVPVSSVEFDVDGSAIHTFTGPFATAQTYSYAWVTGGVSTGSHTLAVKTSGNGCTGVTKSIPITTH